MNEKSPLIRKDLEFIPVQHGDQRFILIKDHFGLVQEGKAVALHLFQFMALLDGTRTVRDLQMELMRQQGGQLIGSDEIYQLLTKLDDSFLLDSERYISARDQLTAGFTASNVRPCKQCGISYPNDPEELKQNLNEILAGRPAASKPEGKVLSLIAPHIDPLVGRESYSSAYQMLKYTKPSRVVLLGIGHQLTDALFCLTEKNFETPLGLVKNESPVVRKLREAGEGVVSETDFAHRSEHSIEFQVIFLQHLLGTETFTIIPILCGHLQSNLTEYNRNNYLKKAGNFLQELKRVVLESDKETLLVAGVDFSHIGPKFGHNVPAEYLENQSTAHDKRLLNYLTKFEADHFWEESIHVNDKFNVCGFPAMTAMLEVLPPCRGEILNHQFHHEPQTQSAVSFAAAVFVSPP